jgi:hypothetical protein
MKKYLYTIATMMLLLSGCASSETKDIEVKTESDPNANLAGYKNYAWQGSAAIVFDDKGRWEPPQFDADAEIRLLIDRELRDHGMTENPVNPDLIVAYAAGIDMDSMEIKVDPESGLERLTNLPVGALSVILVDAVSGQAIWIGVASANIQESPTPETTRKRLDFAVTQMFARLPH